jgi:hypothetical protein
MALMRNLGADVLLYRLLTHLTPAELNLGQYERVRALGCEELARTRQMEAWAFVGLTLVWLAQVSVATGEYREGSQTLHEAIPLLRRAGARDYVGRGLSTWAHAARGLGQTDQAWECAGHALRLGLECEAVYSLLLALSAITLLLADRDQVEWAVELYALASRYPIVANSCWFEDVAGRHLATVAAGLPDDVREQAQARGQARDLWATARELLEELDA